MPLIAFLDTATQCLKQGVATINFVHVKNFVLRSLRKNFSEALKKPRLSKKTIFTRKGL